MLAVFDECQIAFANLVMTRIVSLLGESQSPCGKDGDSGDPNNAATVQCADDTEATCTSTALIDVRALFERAKAILAQADASARPTSTQLLYHLDLEASGGPTKAEATTVLNALQAAVPDPARHHSCTRCLVSTPLQLAICSAHSWEFCRRWPPTRLRCSPRRAHRRRFLHPQVAPVVEEAARRRLRCTCHPR